MVAIIIAKRMAADGRRQIANRTAKTDLPVALACVVIVLFLGTVSLLC
jgi:hypothetical protein